MIGGLVATLVGSAWARAALGYSVTVLAILLFLLALRRSGERAGRLAEQLETMEKTHDAQRRMLEAAARRPRDRGELVERLRDGGFCNSCRRKDGRICCHPGSWLRSTEPSCELGCK